METELQTLLKSLYAGIITNQEFLERYFDDEMPSTEYVAKLLAKANLLKSPDIVEEAIVLL